MRFLTQDLSERRSHIVVIGYLHGPRIALSVEQGYLEKSLDQHVRVRYFTCLDFW